MCPGISRPKSLADHRQIFTGPPCDIQPCISPRTHSIIALAKGINSAKGTWPLWAKNRPVTPLLSSF